MTTLVLHVSQAIAAGLALSALATFLAAFSARVFSIICQYCGLGPANADVPMPIARAKRPNPNVFLVSLERFIAG